MRAEPRNRTRPRGVRRSLALSAIADAPLPDGVAHAPNDDGQRKASDQRRPRHLIAQGRIQPITGVPHDMANAADEMMEERPGEERSEEHTSELQSPVH